MTVEETILSRLNELIEEGRSLRIGGMQVKSQSHAEQCKGWIASASHIVQLIFIDPSSSYRKFTEDIASRDYGYGINKAVGEITEILHNVLKDINKGLISSITDQARAEVFDDFLDHAKAYLKDDMKNEAGVIAGVVFEDTLRRVCRKLSIEEHGVKMDALISQLASRGILTATKAKRARAAADVRTKATHAQWKEFDKGDVSSAIAFTEELIISHIES
jgi:predicted Ser/Thr protein kinase